MKTPVFHLTLVAALLTAAVPAHADVSVQVRLGQFGFRLTDLDRNDGIQPGISFTPLLKALDGGTSVKAWAQEDREPLDWLAQEFKSNELVAFKRMGVGASTPAVQAAARVNGSFGANIFESRLFAGGSLINDAGTTVPRDFVAEASSSFQNRVGFVVTPNTRVDFIGHLRMDVERTVTGPSLLDEQGSALIAVNYSYTPFARTRYDNALHLDSSSPLQASLSQRLVFRYENATAEQGDGIFGVTVQARGFTFANPALHALSPAAPVPEPGSAVLALCGLGVVAGAARYTRRRQGG